MIKLFVADVDGCLCIPFESPHWESITRLRKYIQNKNGDTFIPEFTLCTGRPHAYAEGLAQWLDVKNPFVFESGGGVYDINTNTFVWNDAFDEEAQKAIRELTQWIEEEILPHYEGLMPEFAKRTDVGMVHPDKEVINEIYPKVTEYVQQNYEGFVTHYTDVSINILLEQSNKGAGVEKIGELLDIGMDEMAYMGDGTNDIPALEKVARPFAPINAREEVKEVAEVIDKEATKALLEAFERVVEYNIDYQKKAV